MTSLDGRTGGRSPAALALVLSGSFAAFVAVTAAVIGHGKAPLTVDSALHDWMLQHRTPIVTAVAVVVTTTGSGVPAYLLAAAGGWFASGGGRKRRVRGGVIALGALLLGQGVRLVIAYAVGRPRPPGTDWASSAGGPGYPSGHTVTSALVAALICVSVPYALQRRFRRPVQVAAITWAALVGLTRIYLGVHWPTDVLGGWLLVTALVAAARLLGRRGSGDGGSFPVHYARSGV